VTYTELNPPPIDEIPEHISNADLLHFPDQNWKKSLDWTNDDELDVVQLHNQKNNLTAPLKTIEGNEFLLTDFPPREYFLGKWLPAKGLTMVHAYRGVGKTLFAMSVGVAVATGKSFAEWGCPAARPVLYIDGEMPSNLLQSRLRAIADENDLSNFKLLIDDQHIDGLPDLSTPVGQTAIEQLLQPGSLLILDNISCLFRSGADENDAR